MRDFLRFTFHFLNYSIRRYRKIVAATVAIIVTGYAARAGMAWGLKVVTDAVVSGDRSSAMTGVIAVVALMLLSRDTLFFGYLWANQWANGAHDLENHLLSLDLTLPRVEHLEDAEYLDRYDLLRGDVEDLVKILWTWIRIAGATIQTVIATVLLVGVHPILAVFPLGVVPVLVADAKASKIRDAGRKAGAEGTRLEQALHAVVTNPVKAKEAKVARAEEELDRQAAAAWARSTAFVVQSMVKSHLLTGSAWLVFGAVQVLTAGWVGLRVTRGQAELGDVVLVITLGLQARGQLGTFVWNASRGMRTSIAFRRYRQLVELHAEKTKPLVDPAPPPDRLVEGIRLEGVGFHYPGTDAESLRRVDLELPAGQTIAIVGENGAGKSTLVKLLCGLYEPSAGRITVDGVDLARVDPSAWRERVAALFQDFARLQFRAGDAIGVGDLSQREDRAALDHAVDRANARTTIDLLPDGYDTQLGRLFEGGVELSGGQWQRLALAQTMMRGQPLLLVLDEPASALDPFAEHDLFERYAQAATAVARAVGTVTVFVSHRFATVRMADRIVVMNKGSIVDVGTHEELMGRGGLYAELYEMQAAAYAES